jgi:hypothetical protein
MERFRQLRTLVAGASADFVTLAAEHIPEAVIAAPNRSVYKEGKCMSGQESSSEGKINQ